MAQGPNDEEYLDLFKPKDQADTSAEDSSQQPESAEVGGAEVVGEPGAPSSSDYNSSPDTGAQDSFEATDTPVRQDYGWGVETEADATTPSAQRDNLRTVGLLIGGGCLLLVLAAVVVFAFFQIFVRRGGDGDGQDTPTPTLLADLTPAPTVPVAESPLVVPLVSSGDVRVPVALPRRLIIGETVFTVQAVNAPVGVWPDAPATGDAVAWVPGTVVNYVLRLAITPENNDLLSTLQVGDLLDLYMSTDLVLSFNVTQVITNATDEAAFFEQVSPQLTLALLSDDSAQRTVVTAAFSDAVIADEGLLSEAVTGMVGMPVDRGPVRVTVIEVYQVDAGEAGLPPATGYLLIDFAVENVDAGVLETEYFQTFVVDDAGERYPLTIPAGQFTHYGLPVDSLAPGETVIGSAGYLIPGSPEGQIRWVFNPLPGSDNWVMFPVSYDLPVATPTQEPPPPVGFARVTIDPDDVFVDRGENLLSVGLEIENISAGVVQVTPDDISLTSSAGAFSQRAAAPLLPWTIEPGEFRRFELQFELPSTNDALFSVLGYTFSIDNLGGE